MTPMGGRTVSRVLIANRGEIALRIVRACRELGLQSVVVCSDVDRDGLAARSADRAVCIGPGPATQSYLRADVVVQAALGTRCDAIHPGYGFLAESPRLAVLARDHGLVFVGPPPEVMQLAGDKLQARRQAVRAGLPVLPGAGVESVEEACEVAEGIGYPVLVKAAGGGGGRGIKLAHDSDELSALLGLARSEAGAAFGDERVYLERFIAQARHIEVQVAADEHGTVIHLGERDCSIQRRNQKLIEESPSPFLQAHSDIRKKMGKAAIRAAEAAEYENAGTIEFLVDAKGNFYFIEMNTRIQVEHPVTEEVTGIDLIKQQIKIANGEKLEFDQGDITFEKHAIECRINAEDPSRNFAPSPGTIGLYYSPGGHGVRVDSHAYSGYVIPPYYDSMIGKLICFGSTRKVALERAYRALSEYLVRGIKTTIPLHKAIMADPLFIEGKATTAYMEEFLSRTTPELFS